MLSKNIFSLQKLSTLPFFTTQTVSDILAVQISSARVFCSRYVKAGLLVHLRNNYFATAQKWKEMDTKELLLAANVLQVPSYISFMTGLEYYGVTTQIQRNYIESASLKRSVEYNPGDKVFRYYKLKRKYYFEFGRKDGLFIATKEKSFLDAVYLYSFGKYRIDFSSLDMKKLDGKKLLKLAKIYPPKTKKILKVLCGS